MCNGLYWVCTHSGNITMQITLRLVMTEILSQITRHLTLRFNYQSSKYTTPPVKMIDDRWAGLPV